MNSYKKIVFILGFLASIVILYFVYTYFITNKSNEIAITIKVKGIQSKIAYLSLIQGGKKTIVDTTEIDGENIRFQFQKPLPIGLYRVIIDEGNYIDLIFDNKTVKMKTDINDLVSEMNVIKSEENKQYYEYLKFSQVKNLKIFDIVAKAKELQADTIKNTLKIDSLKKEIDLVILEKNKFITELTSKNTNTIASRIMKSYILPDFEAFKNKNPTTTYKNKNEYLGDHFFDYINFNDTILLNTDVFYNACNNYIRNFISADGNGYKKAIDMVLFKSGVNTKVNNYFLNLFVETFEESSWEDVFTYLVENYYLQSYCESDDPRAKDLKDKTEAIKKLSIGNKAPEIELKNENNKSVSLYSLNSNLILLFFWKSSCEYCEESIPKLKKLYNSYKNNGFEIIAISIDTIQTTWKDAIKKNDLKWLNVSDFKGYKSEVSKDYYVWRTPTFYLLDNYKIIISKPISVEQIEGKLEKIFGQINIDKNTK